MDRSNADHFWRIALSGNRIVGMIEVRDHDHVSLLFVDPDFHHKGIAKDLIRQTVQICRTGASSPSEISVNSSAYAVPVCEKLGFRRAREKQVRNGIVFIPMILNLVEK